MFVKCLIDNVENLIHENVTYKVIKGIADVPGRVAEYLTKFPHWNHTDEVPTDVAEQLNRERPMNPEPTTLTISEVKISEKEASKEERKPTDKAIKTKNK